MLRLDWNLILPIIGSIFFANQINKKLEVLSIKTESITTKQLKGIALAQPNIKTAHILSETNVSADAIIDFVEKSKQLNTFSLQIGSFDVTQQKILEARLQRKWDIEFSSNGGGTTVMTLIR